MDNEISIIPFRYKYLSILLDLLKSNEYPNADSINMKTLPKIGYIALLNGYPIAAGFLRKVEGGYGQIDTLVTNKTYGSIVRHQGITKVVESLLQDAKDLKLKGLIGFTKEISIVERSKSYGFSIIDQVIIAKNLT